MNSILPGQLHELLTQRRIYLWGARQLGFSIFEALARQGFEVEAFLDSSRDLQGQKVLGRPVLDPKSLLSQGPSDYLIIITSGFYYEEIAARCREAGLTEGRDFLLAADLQRFDYQIDVSGSCNLRCISCPRGNFRPQPAAGFMSPANFELVLDKILREDPLVGAVALYNFGEPLLNPHLPEIIRLAARRGVRTAVSTNLSFRLDFTEVIKAAPTWFRVSVSGFGPESYEQTHTGGDWNLFLANLHKLKALKDEHCPDLNVEVFYHIYKNRRDDYLKMRDLCQSLGLPLRVRHAALAPLDVVRRFVRGQDLPPEAEAVRQLQILPLDEAMELARQQQSQPCPYQRCLWITWDLKVRECMEWFAPDLDLAQNFLDSPLEELATARTNSAHCQSCMAESLHRCYLVYGDESLIEKRGSLEE